MDIAIVREVLMAAEEAAAILDTDAEMRAAWAKARLRLAPFRIGKRGNIEEWPGDLVETEVTHRHVSHLFGLHPGTQIQPRRDQALTEAAKKVLEIRGDAGTGWSMAWKMCFRARLLEGERAHKMVVSLLNQSKTAELRYNRGGVLPNLFSTHPPFQIDGNFGGAAGIAEMLLQSQNGELDLLPALPKAWADGEFSGFGARGGFVVDAKWSGGKLESARVTARVAGKARVRYGEKTREVALARGGSVRLDGKLDGGQ
jgi:alpha-L-fucosidase 2